MRFVRTLSEHKILGPEDVEVLSRGLADVAREARVVLLYLHGAHAKGTQGPLSDIDIAVLFDHAPGRGSRVHLDFLSSLERAAAREDVDLVVLNSAGPIIRDRVVRNGRLVYARSGRDRAIFEAAAIKEALDFGYFSRIYDDALFRQLEEGTFLDRS